jgi:hypothetical protein
MRFDEAHYIEEIFLAFAGAAGVVTPSEDLSVQSIIEPGHTHQYPMDIGGNRTRWKI